MDCFYKLVSPSGMSGDEMKMMTVLNPGWESQTIKEDTSALQGMTLRLRFNSDMFQKVCLVRTECELDIDELGMIINSKYKTKELEQFLNEASV